MEIAHYSLIVLGLIYLVTEAVITKPLRMVVADLHPLLAVFVYCPACVGFWVGLAAMQLWPYTSRVFESAIAGCAIGALWGAASPGVWKIERGNHATTSAEILESRGKGGNDE